jgi:hypothetical protein
MEFDAATQIDTLIKQAKDAGYNSLGDAMNDKVNKLNRGTDAAIAMQAGKASVLSVAAADPTPTWTVSANSFASTIQCPFNILFGKQTGNLASEEDKTAWANRCNARRWGFMSDVITRVIERFWTIGIIDPPHRARSPWRGLTCWLPVRKKSSRIWRLWLMCAENSASLRHPAVDENEVRAVGELEPRKEVAQPDPNDKVTTDDPLSDDPGAKSKVGTPIIPRSKVDPTQSARPVSKMFQDIEGRYLDIKRRFESAV